MVQTKSLEKAIEASIAEGKIGAHERSIDIFLNENEPISTSSSSKLHDSLYRIWTSSDFHVIRPQPKGKEADAKTKEPDANLTPTSTTSLDVPNIEKTEEALQAIDPRVIFLEALNKLGPCLINKYQLRIWWRELSSYAIDSTGQRLDLAEQSRAFITGVLSGSFYEYGDAENSKLYTELACTYGRYTLELYLSGKLPEESSGPITEERVRIVRQTCRDLFGQFARRENKAAFTMINEYFVKREFRVDLLDLIVEYLSESQNSKLFRIYETPFFESLLTCLEKDTARTALQLGITALSMIIVHICDKLVSTGLLFRIYACFGRACSWQPTAGRANGENSATNDENDDEDDEAKTPLQGGETHSSAWQVVSDSVSHSDGDMDNDMDNDEVDTTETIKVVSLFTFLYGLFPINTLQFCRQCDEYFAKHNYKRRFTDFWSRFMVTKSAESMVRQFRVDPLFIQSTEENELASSVPRFQNAGSSLGITSICTSRRVIEDTMGSEDKLSVMGDETLQLLLSDHGQAFQMRPEGTAGYWHRELLLLRSELAFANFSKYMSEQRSLRWQKRASGRLITEGKNEELVRQNRVLRSKVGNLETEAQRAVHSARTIMRERSAYESKLLHKNREFREKLKEMEQHIMELNKQNETASMEVAEAEGRAARMQDLLTRTNEELRATRNESETAATERPRAFARAPDSPDSAPSASASGGGANATPEASLTLEKNAVTDLERQIETLNFRIRETQEEAAAAVKSLEADVRAAQAETVAARAAAARPRPTEIAENSVSMRAIISEKTTTISRLKAQNEELSRRTAALEHELRARKVHEEERLNELQVALMSSRPYVPQEAPIENRFRGRGGAQGIPRRG